MSLSLYIFLVSFFLQNLEKHSMYIKINYLQKCNQIVKCPRHLQYIYMFLFVY